MRVAKTDLDDLIADLKGRGTTELVLLEPGVDSGDSVEEWSSVAVVYQLEAFVPRLGQRVAVLKQLTFLDGSDNAMRGVAWLEPLTQLNALNLGDTRSVLRERPRWRPSLDPLLFRKDELQERKQNGKATIERREPSYDVISVHKVLDDLKPAELPAWATQPQRDHTAPEGSSKDPEKRQPAAFEKTIHIFLASSSELRNHRDALDLSLLPENDQLRKRRIYLQVHCWERFLDVMSTTRRRDA